MRVRKYKPGESLPDNVCPYCRQRRITRGGGGSCCGKPGCLARLNADSVDEGQRFQSANNEKVRVRGSRVKYVVKGDKTIKGVHCYRLYDKQTGDYIWRPISDCELQ